VFSAPALELSADRKRAGALVGHPPQDDLTMDAVVFIGKALTDRLDGTFSFRSHAQLTVLRRDPRFRDLDY
jgi:hypothetical protein